MTTGLVGLRLLIRCRWMAVLGQALVVFVVHYGLGFPVPLGPVLGLILASFLLNLICVSQQHLIQRLDDRTLCGFIIFDIAQLSALLYLTGGTANPFVILLLGPVVVAAILLSFRLMLGIMTATLFSLGILALFHQPLPWPEPGFSPPPLYVAGCWAAMGLAMVFICVAVGLIQRENHRMNQALTVTQMALAREQEISALGTLAAAAAHELGSPLATLRLVATEMARMVTPDHPMAGDIDLLVSETARCRDILADLSRYSSADQSDHPFNLVPLATAIDQIIAPWLSENLRYRVDNRLEAALNTMPILMTPELRHGLGNLFQNACQFAQQQIIVTLDNPDDRVRITIQDDGPGFSSGILHRLGEPYLSVRPIEHAEHGNLGLGIFIARTLLEKQHADISFMQADPHGAIQIISWHRRDFLALGNKRV